MLPVTFGYSLSSLCRYETIEEMKEAMTKVIDTLTQEDFYGSALQPEEITSKGTRVSCVYYQ